MKTRVITAAVGIPVLLLLALVAPLWAFGAVLGLLCALAAYELMHCSLGEDFSRRVTVTAMVCALAFPLMFSFGLDMHYGVGVLLVLFFVLSMELMFSFTSRRRLTLEMVALSMLAGGVLPLMLSMIVRIGGSETAGRARMLIPFVVAFSTDAGAYFVGRKWGKRKLAPHISPHKTMEGALGGIAAGVVASLIYGLILMGCGLGVSLPSLALFGLVGGFLAELGDLTFSSFKRQYGVKDFSNVLPGHGGILDRFDSLYYLAPLADVWMTWFPTVWP